MAPVRTSAGASRELRSFATYSSTRSACLRMAWNGTSPVARRAVATSWKVAASIVFASPAMIARFKVAIEMASAKNQRAALVASAWESGGQVLLSSRIRPSVRLTASKGSRNQTSEIRNQ